MQGACWGLKLLVHIAHRVIDLEQKLFACLKSNLNGIPSFCCLGLGFDTLSKCIKLRVCEPHTVSPTS